MFIIELDNSKLSVNNGEKVSTKDLLTTWLDKTKRGDIIKIDHIQMPKPEILKLSDIKVNQLGSHVGEFTDSIKVMTLYISYMVEFVEDKDVRLFGTPNHEVLLYEGKATSLDEATCEITKSQTSNKLEFRVPTYVDSVDKFREYIISRDRFVSIKIHKLYPGMRILAMDNDTKKVKLLTVENVVRFTESMSPVMYACFNINPIDNKFYGKENEQYVLVNDILVKYGGDFNGI